MSTNAPRRRVALAAAALSVGALASVAPAQERMPAGEAGMKPMMPDEGMMMSMYEVTITNLTTGQPLSPPVIATHDPSVFVFKKGQAASASLKLLAEDGKNLMLAGELGEAAAEKKVTDVVALGMGYKIMPGESKTFMVAAKPGDVLSVATMLAATNDGFTGVSGMKLDGTAPMMTEAMAMDAGTEQNTERMKDVPAPSMGMGMAPTTPAEPVMEHKGITGKGDLDKAMFGWTGPVARIEVKKAMMDDAMMKDEKMMPKPAMP